MKTFKVPVLYQVWGLVEVEAESKEALLQNLSDPEFIRNMSLPDEPEYVEDSFEIDTESCFQEELISD